MVESRKQEVRSGDLRVRVESVGCGGWAPAGLVWGEGRPHQQLAPTPPQPHLRSRDELAGEDVGCDVSWAYLGGVWRCQWPKIWGGLCEDIVAKQNPHPCPNSQPEANIGPRGFLGDGYGDECVQFV